MLNKIIYSDNGTLSDLSSALGDYYGQSSAISYTAGQDYLYIGSRHPFNRKHFKLSVVNAVTASVSIDYWDGAEWQACVEIIDETASSGAPLAQEGYISWVPDKRYDWCRDDTTVDGVEKITGLGNVTVYDSFWVRVSFSANVFTTLDWVGDLFCSDDDLGAEFPDLVRSSVMTAFKAGKSDWEEQRMVASALLIQDLKSRKAIDSGDQILERDLLKRACVARTAEVIMNGLDGMDDRRTAAHDLYLSRIDADALVIDQNGNGRADPSETCFRSLQVIR